MKVERLTPWLLSMRPSDGAQVRIFCLPFAGGGASAFRRWAEFARDGLELCAVQLPGREDRLAESAADRLTTLIEPIAEQVASYSEIPFALLGHSMGAVLAFETARALRRMHARPPVHLFVSARRAPHLPTRRRPLHGMPDIEFLAELRGLQGTPAAVLEDRELMDLLTPLLRADFAVCETYDYRPEPSLEVGITAFGGVDDDEATADELAGWARHTNRFGGVHLFPGHHFFLQDHRHAIVEAMRTEVRMPATE